MNSIGDPRKVHPVPLRSRNPFVDQDQGGSKGYRGPGWEKARKRALKRGGYKSSVGSYSEKDGNLEVDHIIPYRIGGLTPRTNLQTNLRITDQFNNPSVDMAQSFAERPPKRRLRAF